MPVRRRETAHLTPDQRDLLTALRRALARARGEIQICPDCSGSGQARWVFGYCLRCDGAGEIAASFHVELPNQDGDAYDVTTEPLAMDGDGDVGRRSSPSSSGEVNGG